MLWSGRFQRKVAVHQGTEMVALYVQRGRGRWDLLTIMHETPRHPFTCHTERTMRQVIRDFLDDYGSWR